MQEIAAAVPATLALCEFGWIGLVAFVAWSHYGDANWDDNAERTVLCWILTAPALGFGIGVWQLFWLDRHRAFPRLLSIIGTLGCAYWMLRFMFDLP